MNKILLGSALAVLLLAGCGDEKKTSTQATAEVVTEKTDTTKEVLVEATKDVSETVSKVATEAADSVKEVTVNVIDDTKEVVAKSSTEVKELANTASTATMEKVEDVKEVTVPMVEKTKEVASDVVAKTTAAVSSLGQAAEEKTDAVVAEAVAVIDPVVEGPSGELLFKSCASCHGQKAEKQALGKSQIIAGWDKEKIINALNGYKDGSYGGVMKNIMKGQVGTKTDAEISALATFISNL
jgi:cytochrome c553